MHLYYGSQYISTSFTRKVTSYITACHWWHTDAFHRPYTEPRAVGFEPVRQRHTGHSTCFTRRQTIPPPARRHAWTSNALHLFFLNLHPMVLWYSLLRRRFWWFMRSLSTVLWCCWVILIVLLLLLLLFVCLFLCSMFFIFIFQWSLCSVIYLPWQAANEMQGIMLEAKLTAEAVFDIVNVIPVVTSSELRGCK